MVIVKADLVELEVSSAVHDSKSVIPNFGGTTLYVRSFSTRSKLLRSRTSIVVDFAIRIPSGSTTIDLFNMLNIYVLYSKDTRNMLKQPVIAEDASYTEERLKGRYRTLNFTIHFSRNLFDQTQLLHVLHAG